MRSFRDLGEELAVGIRSFGLQQIAVCRDGGAAGFNEEHCSGVWRWRLSFSFLLPLFIFGIGIHGCFDTCSWSREDMMWSATGVTLWLASSDCVPCLIADPTRMLHHTF